LFGSFEAIEFQSCLDSANKPTMNVPKIPGTPCKAATSSASSTPMRGLIFVTQKKEHADPHPPMRTEVQGTTKPDPGVMAASPAKAPFMISVNVHFFSE
jgi:hypothetical protein